MAAHRLDAEREAEFREMFLSGYPYAAIRDHFGWKSDSTILHFRLRFQLPKRERGLNAEQEMAARKLADAGLNPTQIAREIGSNKCSVTAFLARQGLYRVRRRTCEVDEWDLMDAAWRRVAGDLRYEDVREPPWSPSRTQASPGAMWSECGNAAAMCVP